MKKYVIAFLFTFASVLVLAQVPGTLSYQGILLDVNGVPVADNTAGYQVTFFFYNVETGGTALEVRGPFTVNTKKGLFTVILGDGTSGNAALPASFGDQQIWMSIKVDADAELSPRVKFTSVPYAYRAENANKATLAAGVEAGKVVQSINSLKDAVTISGSSGVTVNSTGNNIDIAGPSSIVNSLNSKTGSVTISAGSNITLTPSGNDLQISAPANLVNKVNNISGDVTIAAGANVTVNNAGNTVTINATASGGNVSGTGTAGYVSFWDGLSSIAGNSNLYWDNTNSRLGVGTGTPSVRLDVNGTANATAFTGDGSGLTALNAGNISSGTLADARLESTVDITSGLNVGTSKFSVDGNGNITKLNNITTSFPSVQGSANSFLSNNGSGALSWVTSISGSQITGTNNLPNGVLSTNLQDLAADGFLSAASLSGSNNLPTGVLPASVPLGNGTSGQVAFWTGTSTISSNAALIWDNTNSRLGIGLLGAPAYGLDIRSTSTLATVKINKDQAAGPSLIDFYRSGTIQGNITEAAGTVSYNSFTGSHYGMTYETLEVGMLMTLSGTVDRINDNSFSEPVYGIRTSQEANDSRILGTYLHDVESENFQRKIKPPVKAIMAVGNGVMWVVDNGENINAGDYLISSGVSGHAMKETGQFERAFVIARAATDINWANVEESIEGVKHARISVFFESFILNNKCQVMERKVQLLEEQVTKLEMLINSLTQNIGTKN